MSLVVSSCGRQRPEASKTLYLACHDCKDLNERFWYVSGRTVNLDKLPGCEQGGAGTEGAFDERMYRYAISMQAQEPNFADECFKVLDEDAA